MRNHGKIMDIKTTAPRIAETVFANIRIESENIDETLSAPKRRDDEPPSKLSTVSISVCEWDLACEGAQRCQPLENRFIIRPSGCHGSQDRAKCRYRMKTDCCLKEGHWRVDHPFDCGLNWMSGCPWTNVTWWVCRLSLLYVVADWRSRWVLQTWRPWKNKIWPEKRRDQRIWPSVQFVFSEDHGCCRCLRT